MEPISCEWCHVKFKPRAKSTRFCSRSCLSKWNWSINRKKMVEASSSALIEARKSPKLKAWQHDPRNPLYDPKVKAKAAMTQRAKGYAHLNGGNGTNTPLPVQALILALGEGWVLEHPVATGGRTKTRPTCYKIDIAHPLLMIAIEVDGEGHHSQNVKQADGRKDQWLTENGWRVMRFTNKQVNRDLKTCVDSIVALVASTT